MTDRLRDPRRLIDSADLGPLLHEARSSSDLTDERMRANARKLQRRLGVALGVSAGAATGATAATSAAKGVVSAIALKVAVPAMIVAATVGGYRLASEAPAPARVVAPKIAPSDSASKVRTQVSALSTLRSPVDGRRPRLWNNLAPKVGEHPARQKPTVVLSRRVRPAVASKDTSAPPPIVRSTTPIRLAGPPSTPPPSRAKSAAKPAPKKRLAEQLSIFSAAQHAARSKDYSKALALLDHLRRRFPRSPLGAEIALSRAEYLIRSSRSSAAIVSLKRLVVDAAHKGRRGELLRALGDMYRRSDRCADAKWAYDRAMKHSLSASNKAAAQRGIAACTR